jgi:hypothetical protein
MASRTLLGVVGALALLPGCGAPTAAYEPVFLAGRAVAPVGDSLFAVVSQQAAAVILADRRGRPRDTLGLGALRNPGHVQYVAGDAYVSDVEDGRPLIAIFGPDGVLLRRLPLNATTAQAHQFAVLPDGGLVVESRDGRLLLLRGDSVDTFAPVEVGTRPSLVLGTGGGVLHAIPDKTITLYNGFGHIRWRIDWPWRETAFVADIAADSRGRIHFLVGDPQTGTFTAQTLAPSTGEVVRWSEPAPVGSFLVDRRGEVIPAGERWGDRAAGTPERTSPPSRR